MTDSQALLGIIVMLILAVLAFAGFRSARKGRVDDSLFDDYKAQLRDIRTQMEQDRLDRIEHERLARAREDELRQRVTELETRLAQAEWKESALRSQIHGLGAVPVV